MFGYVEATHYWYKSFAKVFVSNVWKKCMKDKCVFVKWVENKATICGLSAGDCLLLLLEMKYGLNNM